MITDPAARAALAFDGVRLGDCFGGQFFLPQNAFKVFDPARPLPDPVWHFTDDTVMALSVLEVLTRHGRIDQDELAARFARKYDRDWRRGYGPGMHGMLPRLAGGDPWQVASREMFSGTGSYGNGAAMRVAPAGAYFADDPARAAAEARLSAEVTHAHPEGVAGAAAVAAACCWAAGGADVAGPFALALGHTPAGETRDGVELAASLDLDLSLATAADRLGNGRRVTAMDTVPLCLWLAARHRDSFTDALWSTIRCGGDVDTTGAIVGGIVALAVGRAGLPSLWAERLEPLGSMRDAAT